MSIQYDRKADKEMYLKVMKYIANDESMTPYLKQEHLKKKFDDEVRKEFGTDNINEVFYNAETDSYEIKSNPIAVLTNPNTKK